MKEFVLFIMTFVFIFIIYEIIVVLKAKKNYKNNKIDKLPVEIKYLIAKYKLDLNKINYNKLLHIIALVSSLDMAIIVSAAMIVESYLLQLLIVLVLIIPVILGSYHIVYLVFKKKGLI